MVEWTTLGAVAQAADSALRAGQAAAPRIWGTGFGVLDAQLGGGLRAGELTLLGGPQGVGKTAWALQTIRNVAVAGGSAVYYSFEHDEQTLLERMLCIESGSRDGVDGLTLSQVREVLQVQEAESGLADRLQGGPGADALKGLSEWGDRVILHRSSGASTTLDVIRSHLSSSRERGDAPVVVVDYLQKVLVPGAELDEAGKVTAIVEGLKDLALEFGVPVVAIVAADREGITIGKRTRAYHLRGSSALAYEADVLLMLNDKYDIVARHHLVYDVGNADRFRDWAVLTIEKNRNGVDRIDLEFRKRLAQGRFEPDGRPVAEQLVDERVFVE